MQDFLRENRTLVIIVALLVIAYLLWDVEVVKKVRTSVMGQWNNLGMVAKVIIALVLAYIVYSWWNCE